MCARVCPQKHILPPARLPDVLTWLAFYLFSYCHSIYCTDTTNTVQVKDERAQEKAKQILRDHGAKVAGGKVVAPIPATTAGTASAEATTAPPPTPVLTPTPGATTNDNVELVIKTRSSLSPSQKKKKAKIIESKHHKRSSSSISTSSHKENGT